MRKDYRRVFQVAVLFLLFILIGVLVIAMTRADVKRLGAGAGALNSPLVVDQSIPVPHEYNPTRIPAEQRASFQPQWQTYMVPGEGITFRARLDWLIASGKAPTLRYSTVRVFFRGTGGSIGFGQGENPQQLPLEEFAKTSATAFGSPHDAKWLSADIKQFARDVSNGQYKRLLIVRDESGKGATDSINGPSKYTVLIAYDQRVLIARSPEGMGPEAEQHFWEVLDSIQFTPFQ